MGAVDTVEGVRIKLTRKDSTDSEHHYIPLAWVASVEERVHLNRTGADVRATFGQQHTVRGRTAAAHDRRKKNWPPWILLGLGLLALVGAQPLRDPQAAQTTATTTTKTAAVDTSGRRGQRRDHSGRHRGRNRCSDVRRARPDAGLPRVG